jgi:hypothetical protein
MSCCGGGFIVAPPFPYSACASIQELSGGTTFTLGPPPPPGFFNISGIYQQRFQAPVVTTFNALYALILATDPSASDPFNNTNERRWVQRMSQSQLNEYEEQLEIFRRVYMFNQAAYNAAARGFGGPYYYRFRSQTEMNRYRAGVALVNKLYQVSEKYPLQCLFFLPFPPFCGEL